MPSKHRQTSESVDALPCYGGPLDGRALTCNASDNLVLDAANGSYWRDFLSSVFPTNPLHRLVHIARWNEHPRFRYPNRAPLEAPDAE